MAMNRTIKTAAILLVLALMLPLLSGCHDNKSISTFTIPYHFDDQTPVEIIFWAKNDSNPTQVAMYQQAIDGFEKLYPNVKVNLRTYTDYGQIYNDVITNISTNTTPNVCITYPDHIATYLTGSNTVAALDDLMEDKAYGLGGSELRFDAPAKEEIVPEFLQECAIGDHTYALPFMRSTEALYINKDYVEALGYEIPDVPTWDFIWEVSEKALEKGENGKYKLNGQKTMIPFIYKSTDNMMITMLKQKEAPYSTADGDILLFNDTTAELLETIYTHARSRAFSTFHISGYPANFLNKGQCIFAIDSTAGATWMGSDAPLMDVPEKNVVRFTTVVRPIPQFDPEHPKMISQGPSVCIFNKENQQEVLASWLFVQYLLTNEIQMGYAETEGYLPVTLKAQNSAEYKDYLNRKGEDKEHYAVKIEASELLMNNTQNTFVTPVFNGSTSVRGAAGEMVEEVSNLARSKQDISREYINQLYGDMRSLYRLEGKSKDIATGAKLLLAAIAAVWLTIGLFKLRSARKNKTKQGK